MHYTRPETVNICYYDLTSGSNSKIRNIYRYLVFIADFGF